MLYVQYPNLGWLAKWCTHFPSPYLIRWCNFWSKNSVYFEVLSRIVSLLVRSPFPYGKSEGNVNTRKHCLGNSLKETDSVSRLFPCTLHSKLCSNLVSASGWLCFPVIKVLVSISSSFSSFLVIILRLWIIYEPYTFTYIPSIGSSLRFDWLIIISLYNGQICSSQRSASFTFFAWH